MCNMAMQDYFETLTDTAFLMDGGIILGAYAAPGVVGPMLDGAIPMERDVPNELYGVAEVVGAEAALSGSNKTLVQYGGVIYTMDQLAERFNVRENIPGMEGGN
jgi:hypothetical protein